MINNKKNLLYKFLFIFFIFLFSIPNIYAKECTNEEYKELKELAKQVQFQYESFDLDKTGGEMGFGVYLYNFSNRFYADAGKWSYINYAGNPQYIGNYNSGNKVKVIIYASSKTNCEDSRLASITLELPIYNPYSFRKECINNKNLDICKKWLDTSNIDEKEFLKLTTKNTTDKNQSIVSIILEFITKYLFFIVGGTVLILSIVVIKIVKKRKNKKIQI